MKLYIGRVFSALNGQLVYRSRPQSSYFKAHELAEKHCIYGHYRLTVDEV